MGVFSKKYDYKKDNLKCKFDLAEDKYCYFIGDKRLSDKELSRKSRKSLKAKNDDITEEQKEEIRYMSKQEKAMLEEGLKRKAALEKRKANGLDLRYNSFEVLSDNQPKFSDEVREFLEDLTSEEKDGDYVVGIHRIGPSDAHLEAVFDKGIIVQGHMSGAARGEPELRDTVGYYPCNSVIMKEVGFAYTYKASKGSFVVKIPKEDIISNNIFITDEEGKHTYLNPKYIVGYFPIEEDKTVSQMVTSDTLEAYREQRKKEAEAYISMGDKKVEYPPQEKN